MDNKSYNESKYNITVFYKNRYIVFNTRTKKLFSSYRRMSDILSNASDSEIEELRKEGFVVDIKTDETEIVRNEIKKSILDTRVLRLTIMPTLNCNFRCIYCYQNAEEKYMSANDYHRLLMFIESYLPQIRYLSIQWFGGEPLLCADEIVAFSETVKSICKENGIIYVSQMTTNGYLLNTHLFLKLYRAGVRYFQITLDGNETEHNRQRPLCDGSGTFRTILDNLLEISKTKKKFFEIGIRINISKYNRLELDKFMDDILSCFKGDKRFTVIWQWVRDWGGNRIKKEDMLIDNAEFVSDLYCTAREKGLNCKEFLSTSFGGEGCVARYNAGIVITPGLRLFKCPMHIDEDLSQIGIISEVGTLCADKTKKERWNAIIESKECEKCAFYPICKINTCPYIEVKTKKAYCMEFKHLMKDQIVMMFCNHV